SFVAPVVRDTPYDDVGTSTTNRSPQKQVKSSLGELERAVMDVLWDLTAGEDFTVREVHTTLSGTRDVAYATVMTVMDRLARKGTVLQHKAGRAYRYQPASSRAEMTADMLRGTLSSL